MRFQFDPILKIRNKSLTLKGSERLLKHLGLVIWFNTFENGAKLKISSDTYPPLHSSPSLEVKSVNHFWTHFWSTVGARSVVSSCTQGRPGQTWKGQKNLKSRIYIPTTFKCKNFSSIHQKYLRKFCQFWAAQFCASALRLHSWGPTKFFKQVPGYLRIIVCLFVQGYIFFWEWCTWYTLAWQIESIF